MVRSHSTGSLARRAVMAALAGLALAGSPAHELAAQETLSGAERARVDSTVTSFLAETGVPSASIAIVRDGEIAYEQAYGSARLEPAIPALPSMRYSIGSVSKQFTATAVLLLAEDGELSLDDPVSRWLPELTRADEVTVGHLLSMTSGYQDFWPHDYVFQRMQRPVEAREILGRWAERPLDFDPGTKWQYSNTNYTIAGLIIEQVSGMGVYELLQERVFAPLGMGSVTNVDLAPLGQDDADGYLRNALAPLRLAPKEAPGWLFAAGELGMTAHDLALWDISMIDQTILTPESYQEMQTEQRLENGLGTGYGLGVHVGTFDGRRRITHGGAVSGYTTSNQVFPDDATAVVVYTNVYPGDGGAPGRIGSRIASILFESADAEDAAALDQAKAIFVGLQEGEIDRNQFSDNGNAYFDQQTLSDYETSLGPLESPEVFEQAAKELRGGMTFRAYRLRIGDVPLILTTRILPDGKIEQYEVERVG